MKASLTKTLKLYKEAYSGHPHEIWAIGIFTFINRMGTMVLPFLTIYLTTVKSFSLKEAGFLITGFGLGSLTGTYIGGKLSDKIGPNPVMTGSLFFSGIFLISLQLADSFTSFFLLIFTSALFGEAYRPAMSAAIGMYVPKSETGRSMAFIRMAINLGWSGAVVVGGFVAATIGYSWLFWIDGSTCILAAIYYGLISYGWTSYKQSQALRASESPPVDTLPPLKNKDFLLFLLSTLLMGLGFVQWFHSIPLFIKTEWGFDERYIGSMMTLNGLLIVLLEMPLVDQIEKAKRIRFSLLGGLSLLGLSFLPFLLPNALGYFFLATVLFTFGEILFLPFNNSIPINISPDNRRGEYMSWYWMAWSLTNILGPTLGLSFIDEFGYPAFWIFMMGLMGISFGIKWKIADRVIV
jgi:predicted MFS family arabinose efflux permease